MAANPKGENGPRQGRSTGRVTQALTNLRTKQKVYPSTLVLRAYNGEELPKPKKRNDQARGVANVGSAPDLRATLERLKAARETYVPQQSQVGAAPALNAASGLASAAQTAQSIDTLAALVSQVRGGKQPYPGRDSGRPLPEGGSSRENMALGKALAARRYGWTGKEWQALKALWMRESGWRTDAVNDSSQASGIPQVLPEAHPGVVTPKFMRDPMAQILWGLRYIEQRYGSPTAALAHSDANHWY